MPNVINVMEYPLTYPRLELVHISYFVTALFFYFVIFLLCIVLSQNQPLKSRGATPILSCIIQFLLLGSGFSVFALDLEKNVKSSCIFYYYVRAPLVIAIIFLASLHFLRYTILINIRSKIRYVADVANESTQNGHGASFDIYLRFLKYSGHPLTQTCIFFVVYVLVLGIFFIVDASDRFNCSVYALSYIGKTVVNTILISIFVGFQFLIVLYDVYLNFHLLKTCKLLKLWREDVFYFRVEIYFLGIFITLPSWILLLALNPIFRGNCKSLII